MDIKSKIFAKLGYVKSEPEMKTPEKEMSFSNVGTATHGPWRTPRVISPWAGERTYGEMGAAYEYLPDYQTLALRSWDSYLNSDIAKAVINNYVLWSIGKGLTLQAEPERLVLQSEGIIFEDRQYSNLVRLIDSRFKIHVNSRFSTYRKTDTLQTLASEVKKNLAISGDGLIVNRYERGIGLNSEFIDGLYVETPPIIQYHDEVKARGNRILHGVEINNRGTHIAFYVRRENNVFERIPARSRTLNKTTAYLVYRDRYRIDYVRGLPLLSVVIQTLKTLERYKDATVGSAEEVAKIALQVVHGSSSTGKNPITNQMAAAAANGMRKAVETQSVPDDALAMQVAMSTGKQVFNNTPDSHIEAIEHKNELYFKEFWEINYNIICGALGIPPEVALGRFEQNFSSSRMAAKAWEYAMEVDRFHFTHTFYKPFYTVWLETQILEGKIQATGYLEAMMNRNYMALEAYRNCRFIGAAIPHVDPEKEVRAQRLLLGDESTPITTYSQASERLNTGDFENNIERISREKEFAKSKGIENQTKEVNIDNDSI